MNEINVSCSTSCSVYIQVLFMYNLVTYICSRNLFNFPIIYGYINPTTLNPTRIKEKQMNIKFKQKRY